MQADGTRKTLFSQSSNSILVLTSSPGHPPSFLQLESHFAESFSGLMSKSALSAPVFFYSMDLVRRIADKTFAEHLSNVRSLCTTVTARLDWLEASWWSLVDLGKNGGVKPKDTVFADAQGVREGFEYDVGVTHPELQATFQLERSGEKEGWRVGGGSERTGRSVLEREKEVREEESWGSVQAVAQASSAVAACFLHTVTPMPRLALALQCHLPATPFSPPPALSLHSCFCQFAASAVAAQSGSSCFRGSAAAAAGVTGGRWALARAGVRGQGSGAATARALGRRRQRDTWGGWVVGGRGCAREDRRLRVRAGGCGSW
eukprot:841189-Rhodomonas_salina.2